jgi:glycine/D-amino acid oxidase-like deaminating enzyme
MTYPKDENGRYLIPSKEGEIRIEADCDCGDGWNVPERAWDWISDRHAHAHNKGRDGLPAGGRMNIQRIAAGTQAQAEPEAG